MKQLLLLLVAAWSTIASGSTLKATGEMPLGRYSALPLTDRIEAVSGDDSFLVLRHDGATVEAIEISAASKLARSAALLENVTGVQAVFTRGRFLLVWSSRAGTGEQEVNVPTSMGRVAPEP